MTLDKNNKENITVKGVSRDIYNEIKKIARETGKTIGELTDEAYNTLIIAVDDISKASSEFINSLKDGSTKLIENIDEIEITGQELRNFSKKLILRNINTLVLKDVGDQEIRNYVLSIQNVKVLKIPANLNKLTLLEKGKYIGKIEII